MPNGDLVAAGLFTAIDGVPANGIARWNGTSWSPLGSGFPATVSTLTVLPGGDLVAGGFFAAAGGSSANRVARWNGTVWSPLGAGLGGVNSFVHSLATLPSGDLVAGGRFTSAGGVPAANIARWNGSSWSAFGAGVEGDLGVVECMASLPNGNLVVGGRFVTAGGLVSPNLAQISTTCPASSVASGTGCSGSGGLMQLSAMTQPWLGGTYSYRCLGMATNAVGFAVFGFGPNNLLLSNLHPAAGAGCRLWSSTEASLLLLPVAGAVVGGFSLPVDPSLGGVVLNSQVLQVEIGTLGDIVWLGGSNALVITLGMF